MVDRQALSFLLAFPVACAAFAADRESVELLKRVSAKVLANSASINNYTCMETVRRDFYRPSGATLPLACPVLMEKRQHPTLDMVLRLTSSDRLRLDVTTTKRGELFSWAGASRFDDAGIEHVVRDGPIGTGSFGTFLYVIFEGDARSFVFKGTNTELGRPLWEYAFDVTRADSHYRVKFLEGNGWTTTAYNGSLMVDPVTAEPVHLTIKTAELPPATGACQTIGTLDFSRVKVGDNDLLLPSRAGQRFIATSGRETENITTFSNCRQYTSESTVTFLPGPEAGVAGGAKGAAAAPGRVPDSLRFAFELTAPIDTDTAAAGDRFAGKLTEALREGKRLLAPKGGLVEGRISRVEVSYWPTEEVLVGLIPETLQIRGAKIPMRVLPAARAPVRRDSRNKGLMIYLPPRGEYSGIFRLAGLHGVLRRGFVSDWMTVLR